jgi:AbrB family looped-hinge helix DNA binding protein
LNSLIFQEARTMQYQAISLSSKGQIVIPAAMRASLGWAEGIELAAVHVGDSVVLKKLSRFPASTVAQVRGILKGKPQQSVADTASPTTPMRSAIMAELGADDDRIKRKRTRTPRKAVGPL